MALWNRPAEDVYGTVSRLPKVVDTLEHLLGDEVYHYHSKMVIKEPFTGGSFCWHQDYGYWYLNGCLFPDMASVMVAVDPNTKENGCLQVGDFQKVHRKIRRMDSFEDVQVHELVITPKDLDTNRKWAATDIV
jgi:ectoine hydroxylase-related dioxygenase (phytanoyl-CoA dioxygenase family)